MKTKKIAQQIRSKLLNILNDKQFHSGEDLASIFGISRSAISNHIKALMALGVDIYSVKGRGYQLSSAIELLDKSLILNTLLMHKNEGVDSPDQLVQVENVVTSTNDIVKQCFVNDTQLPSGYCCLAEAQSSGRGRRGRTWVSPFGSSIYMSMFWRFTNGYQAMAGLSLMIGVSLNNTLKELGLMDCKLKWPNDVYHDGKKLAGILIEVEGQVGADASAIIGVGINMSLPENVQGIDQAFTDVNKASHSNASRNTLVSRFISNLWKQLPVFEKQGLGPFLDDWDKADLYRDQKIKLISGSNEIVGVNKGVDEQGALLLEVNNNISAYHGGEISVRAL